LNRHGTKAAKRLFKLQRKAIVSMQQTKNRKLTGADIGYHGKPIDALTREELLDAFIEPSQMVYDCAALENRCKDLLKVET
jgi:adenosylmethionine-8-amino-7-oxononanoate aminotransferase